MIIGPWKTSVAPLKRPQYIICCQPNLGEVKVQNSRYLTRFFVVQEIIQSCAFSVFELVYQIRNEKRVEVEVEMEFSNRTY